MSTLAFKKKFIEALYRRDAPEPHIRGESYVVRCPYCGDSDDIRKAHFYITVPMDDYSAIVYNCFHCPVGGIMTRDVMHQLGILDEELLSGMSKMNRNVVHYDKKEVHNETRVLYFDYQLPDVEEGPKLDYIRNRLDIPFQTEDFQKMKVITSFQKFLKLNNIKKLTCTNKVAWIYERYFVGFLSHGDGYILFRDISGKSNIPWIKYPITKKAMEGKVFYSLSSEVDIFSEEPMVVNLTEGVFDILGVCYHFPTKNTQTINIAVTGKYYDTILYYLISLGVVGSNVTINIYADNDREFNKKTSAKNRDDTSLEYYQKKLKNFRYLFKAMYVFYNEIGKDLGVPKNEIALIRHKL